MATFLERYLAGEHEAVWNELTALGDRALQPGILPDARAVARETTSRALRNLHTLASRLEALGYRFGDGRSAPGFSGLPAFDAGALQTHFANMPESAQRAMGGGGMLKALQSMMGLLAKAPPPAPRPITPIEPPAANPASLIAEAEDLLGGPLPLALAAWYEIAGGVSFQGVHESLNPANNPAASSSAPARPTLMMGPSAHTTGSHPALEQARRDLAAFGFQLATEPPAAEPQPLPDPIVLMPLEELLAELDDTADQGFPGPIALAPDDLHKAGISGATWDMQLPTAAADCPFGRWPGFIPYLREVCSYGGFPGWSRETQRPAAELARLTQDLIPF